MKRRRPKPDFAVADMVYRLSRRFEYPDLDTKPPASRLQGGAGAPTVVIAAFDATAISREKADLRSEGGLDDETLFLQAIDIIGTTGGRILLTEGHFSFSTGFTIPDMFITIQGMGRSTVIQPSVASVPWLFRVSDDSGGTTVYTIQLKDFALDGNPAGAASATTGITTQIAVNNTVLLNNLVVFGFTNGVDTTSRPAGNWYASRCHFFSNTNGVTTRESHFNISNCRFTGNTGNGFIFRQESHNRIVENYFEGNGTAIGGGNAISGGQDHVVCTGNVFRDNTRAIDIPHGNSWIVSGNRFNGNTTVIEVGAGAFGTSNFTFVVANAINGFTNLSIVNGGGSSVDFCANIIDGVVSCGIAEDHDHVLSDLTDVDLTGLATGDILQYDGTDWVPVAPPGGSSMVAFSQTGTLTTGAGTMKMPFAIDATIIGVQLAVDVSPTGDDLIVDVHKNGTTIFTTQANRPIVADGDADGVGPQAIPDVTAIAPNEYLTVEIDQIGSTLAGADLTVAVEWVPTT